VRAARAALEEGGLTGEVIVADNGSDDGSGALAEAAGARVVSEPRRGYGSAYLAGFAAAQGRFIVMADADLTYDFSEIPRFVDALEAGADLVIGNRMDSIDRGAMPWHHRYIGNPVLTRFLNLLYGSGVRDAHCGMRALRRAALQRLELHSTGMEFASEMVIRATKERMAIDELTIEYHPRGGKSKLSPLRDGWRHLRLLLVHSPTALFLVPGGLMLLLGLIGTALVAADISILGRQWYLHTEIAAALLTIVGSQVISLGVSARAYGVYHLGEKPDRMFIWGSRHLRLETGLAIGAVLLLAGMVIAAVITATWIDRGFGNLGEERLAVVGALLIILGLQTIFSSFFLSILGMRRGEAGLGGDQE
jgi:glycosyltransferase involved in cell wall biosynthesis